MILTRDVTECGLRAGDVGAVVEPLPASASACSHQPTVRPCERSALSRRTAQAARLRESTVRNQAAIWFQLAKVKQVILE